MNNKKTIYGGLTVVVTIFAILGGMWGFEDRYAKSVEVAELEVQVVQSLKQYNQQQTKAQQTYEYKNEYKFYQFLYDKLGRDLLEIRRQLRRDPTDQFLKQDYVDIQNQRNGIKVKMNELMQKIR